MSLRDFGVPKKHATPLDEGHVLQESPALVAAKAWWDAGPPLMLVLAGDVGLGKSLAAAWLVAQKWARVLASPQMVADGQGNLRPHRERLGGLPLWLPAPLLGRIAAWDERGMATWSASRFLVIDDLGTEDLNDKARAAADDLLRARDEGELPTIITTNLDRKAFRERYGHRIVDRLRAAGIDAKGNARWWITCTGESMRGRVTPLPRVPEGAEESDESAELDDPVDGEELARRGHEFAEELRRQNREERETQEREAKALWERERARLRPVANDEGGAGT